MLHAMEQIRRMRGGAQSHLMRCSDGRNHDLYYVVKFQNNLQHSRVLVNELLGTRLAARMGLPVPPVAFAGMLVFDKWTCNTNGRQTLFFRDGGGARSDATPGASQPTEAANAAGRSYRTVMIDQGFCFNAGEWNYPDAPLRGLYTRNRVYEGVTPRPKKVNASVCLHAFTAYPSEVYLLSPLCFARLPPVRKLGEFT
jgi:hypothetical protein